MENTLAAKDAWQRAADYAARAQETADENVSSCLLDRQSCGFASPATGSSWILLRTIQLSSLAELPEPDSDVAETCEAL
jgi:hypothetical protein